MLLRESSKHGPQPVSPESCTLNEFWRIRRRCSFSLSNGSLQRRTNDRLYSNREEDLCSLTGDRLVLSRALYKSPNESAWCLRSRSEPTEGSEELLAIITTTAMYSNSNVMHKYIVLYISNGYFKNHHNAFKYMNMVLYACWYRAGLKSNTQCYTTDSQLYLFI